MPPNEYPVYAPALIVEVLSPSNAPAKISQQRIVAMSAGTLEFWVGDPEKRTVQVTDPAGLRTYSTGDSIAVSLFQHTVSVNDLFTV